ncbi:MAG: hypothetical protein R2939_17490 [Kofleriaceae bacterium]
MSWLARHRLYLLSYVVGVALFAAVAGDRLLTPSAATHFVQQAQAWLHGRVDLAPRTPGRCPLADDCAVVSTVVLDDGAVVRGRELSSRRGVFRTTGGAEVATSRIRERRPDTYYVSFPPLPAVVMLLPTALAGAATPDVLITVLIAALALPLLLSILRRLAADGLGPTRTADQLWLLAALGPGSVFFFAAVGGKVWFTAHVIGVVLCLAYVRASLGARHPLLAGLALGAAAITRTPMAFMFPLFALEALTAVGGVAALRDRATRATTARALARTLATFAAPVVVIAVAAMMYNALRFDAATEFGHSYLAVRQQAQIEVHGLFSYSYLARNLAVAFTLLPEFPSSGPWIQISGHGLAMWITTPALVLLLWPRHRPALARHLWITVACVAVPTFFYQNSGWVQFGYRFSLDYLPMLLVLLAVGGRATGRGVKVLIALGIVVNLFGALTFDRHPEYYRTGGRAYETVVAH